METTQSCLQLCYTDAGMWIQYRLISKGGQLKPTNTIYVSKFGKGYRISHLTIGQDLKTSRGPLHSKHCNLNGFQIDLELQLEVRGIYIPHLGNPCHPLIPQPNMEQGGTTLKIANLAYIARLSNMAPETNAKEQHTEKVQVYNHPRDKCKRHNPWFTYIFLNRYMKLCQGGWYFFLRGNAPIVLSHMYLQQITSF